MNNKENKVIPIDSAELNVIITPKKDNTEELIDISSIPDVESKNFMNIFKPLEKKKMVVSTKNETQVAIDKELVNEIKEMLIYLDALLGKLPEDIIKDFALSEKYDQYVLLLEKLGLKYVIGK